MAYEWIGLGRCALPLVSTSIAARMLQLLGLPTLLYEPRVRTNLEVTVLYTQVNVMGSLFFIAKLVIYHYYFSNHTSIDSKEALLPMRKREVYTKGKLDSLLQ